jgi:hypothetical protein
MAAYEPAINRIKYLITGKTYPNRWQRVPSNDSPATISGGPESIYSYRLRIARKDGEDWVVTNERNSPTTNRHIAACHMAMTELGFLPADGHSGHREYDSPPTRYVTG